MPKAQNESNPLLSSLPVHAGFPNPASDAGGRALDLNDILVKNYVTTYFLRVDSEAMAGAAIYSGDILVVDKSLEPRGGDLVVAAADGDFVLRRLKKEVNGAWLLAENPDFQPIPLHDNPDARLWGVVTFVIHKART